MSHPPVEIFDPKWEKRQPHEQCPWLAQGCLNNDACSPPSQSITDKHKSTVTSNENRTLHFQLSTQQCSVFLFSIHWRNRSTSYPFLGKTGTNRKHFVLFVLFIKDIWWNISLLYSFDNTMYTFSVGRWAS